jgi:phosphoglycolate phosphatase
VSQVRLVVFDLDGTLVDSAQDLATGVNEALSRVAPGRPPLSLDVVKAFVGDGAAVLIQRTLGHIGLDLPKERVLPVFLECYARHLLDTTRLYPGTLETLDRLADRTLAVLSNKPGELGRALLDGLGVGSLFARIWGPDDAGGRKPDPSGLHRLLANLGFTAAESAMVGDSGADVRAGRAAGLRTIGATWGLNPASLLAEPADRTIDDIRALPEALDDDPSPQSSVLP